MRLSPSFQLSRIKARPALIAVWTCAAILMAMSVAGAARAQDEPAASGVTSTESSEADRLAGSESSGNESPGQESSADDATPAQEGSDSEEEIEWLEDEDGKVYRVVTFPKIKGAYFRPRDGWIRLPYGVTLPLIKESDDTFWVKYFKPGQFGGDRARPRPATPTPAEVEKRYETNLEQVDRLRLVPFEKGLPRSGQWRDGFEITDINGDGHLDIVSGPPRKLHGSPVIFLGDSAGNWSKWQEASFERAGYDYGDVTVGDWNGDGHKDLAFGVHLRGVLALMNDGEGHFEVASEGIDFDVPGDGTALTAFSSKALQAYDWNNDGRLDILAQGEGPKQAIGGREGGPTSSTGFRVFLNRQDGVWEELEISPANNRNFAGDFALLDMDLDGRADIVTATNLLGNKNIVLRRTSDLDAQLESFDLLPERGLVDAVEVADIDADGEKDLVLSYRASVGAGSWRSGIDVLLRDGDGWERKAVLSLKQREPFRAIAAADVDGDGHQDLAALDDIGALWLFLGQGDGSFLRELTPEGPPSRLGCQGFDLHLRDLDNDGKADIVAAFAGEQVSTAMLIGADITGCDREGSLRAWKIESLPQTDAE